MNPGRFRANLVLVIGYGSLQESISALPTEIITWKWFGIPGTPPPPAEKTSAYIIVYAIS